LRDVGGFCLGRPNSLLGIQKEQQHLDISYCISYTS
jgi:hypothetical protein